MYRSRGWNADAVFNSDTQRWEPGGQAIRALQELGLEVTQENFERWYAEHRRQLARVNHGSHAAPRLQVQVTATAPARSQQETIAALQREIAALRAELQPGRIAPASRLTDIEHQVAEEVRAYCREMRIPMRPESAVDPNDNSEEAELARWIEQQNEAERRRQR